MIAGPASVEVVSPLLNKASDSPHEERHHPKERVNDKTSQARNRASSRNPFRSPSRMTIAPQPNRRVNYYDDWLKRAKASASPPKGGAGVFPFPAQEKTSKRRIRIHKTYPCDPPSRLTTLYWDMAHKKGEVDVSQLILKRWGNKGAEHRPGPEISEVFRDYWKEQDKL